MKVAFHTLGCKVNQNDTQGLIEIFRGKGYEIVPFGTPADIYVINTCAVTHIGEGKSRQAIRKAAGLNPKAVIAVTGCYAQVSPQQIAGIPGVNLVVGMEERPRIVELVDDFLISQCNSVNVQAIEKSSTWINLPASPPHRRTRAFLKVEEGCEQFCSYCIVPYARGKVRSMPLPQVIREFSSLVANGYQEIVCTGIHLGIYGRELGTNLADLLREVLKIEGRYRIRLGSIEPNDFQENLIQLIVNNQKVCQHLHIPLQSGNDRILNLMNRGYDTGYFAGLLEKLRRLNPMIAIGTDLIVGFPGETEEDFLATCNFVRKQGFSRIHVFRYSPRQGTPASTFPGRVPRIVQEERSKKIQEIANHSFLEYAQKFLGVTVEVLFEEQKPFGWSGLSGEYLRVETKTGLNLKNFFVPVCLDELTQSSFIGVINDNLGILQDF